MQQSHAKHVHGKLLFCTDSRGASRPELESNCPRLLYYDTYAHLKAKNLNFQIFGGVKLNSLA